MNKILIEDVAAAVLYEGYLLYPYRASAIKNQQRWNFGVLYPCTYATCQSHSSDAWSMSVECLLKAAPEASPAVRVRFLHQMGAGAREREILLPHVPLRELASLPLRHAVDFVPDGDQQPLEVAVEVSARRLAADLFKLSLQIFNRTPFSGHSREDALKISLISTHAILGVDKGEYISLLDPPEDLRSAVSACENSGLWPVLVGEEGERDAMLCSPIILYDYPKIAPESAGPLFDGTEIDEILTLRILTMTDEEKRAMAQTDVRAREILERTEAMPPEQFMKLHGVLREIHRELS